MSPDISSIPNGDAANDTPALDDASMPYEIDQEAMFNSYQRKVKVLTIGAGVSGILMAYKIQKESKNVEHVIYEKNTDVGGTWFENRYPNCACDVPSYAYIYNFAPNVGFLIKHFLNHFIRYWDACCV